MIALTLVTTGCLTTPTELPQYVLPTLDAFEPERIPADLIAEPMTDADLLHNSIQYEFGMYAWQDAYDALKKYLAEIRKIFAGE